MASKTPYLFRSNTIPIVILVFLFFSACNKNDGADDETGYNGPMSTAEDFVALYSDSAQVKFNVQADHQEIFESEDMKLYGNLKVYIYGATDTTVTALLKADTAHYIKTKNRGRFIGNIEAENFIKKVKLNTDEIYYGVPENNQELQKKYPGKQIKWQNDSTVKVRVESPGQLLYGKGLIATQDFSWYQIQNPVGEFEFFKDEERETD